MTYPTDSSFQVAKREERKRELELIELRTSESVQEREYYFDEGLGQSLNEHTVELRKQYPNIKIQTRRDRDGFPVVKVSMKKEYKYKLEEILETDPQELKTLWQETQEAALGVFMPEDPKEFVEQAASGQYLDGVDGQAMHALMEERFSGRFQDDLPGFIEQCKLLKQAAKKSSAKKGSSMARGALNEFSLLESRAAADAAFHELLKDKGRFDAEVQEQIALKIRDKQQFGKLTEQDLVKPARSENLMYRDQVQTLGDTIDILEKDNEWLLKHSGQDKPSASAGFDQEKFNQIKKEIKLRKEAKQRILHQGFPEFKPYIRM